MDHVALWITAVHQLMTRRPARRRGEHGAETVEYVLLLALIFLVALVSMRLFGSKVTDTLNNNSAAL